MTNHSSRLSGSYRKPIIAAIVGVSLLAAGLVLGRIRYTQPGDFQGTLTEIAGLLD